MIANRPRRMAQGDDYRTNATPNDLLFLKIICGYRRTTRSEGTETFFSAWVYRWLFATEGRPDLRVLKHAPPHCAKTFLNATEGRPDLRVLKLFRRAVRG